MANRLSFYPFDLPGLIAWHRSDVGVCTDRVTGRVRAWGDLSGLGNNAVAYDELPAAVKALYLSQGMNRTDAPALIGNAWDGKPVVRGVRANPNGEALFLDHRISPPALTTLSVFFVVTFASTPPTNGTQFRLLAQGMDQDPDRIVCMLQNSTGTIQQRLFAGGALLNAATIDKGRHILSYILNGASSRVRQDQGADTTGNPGTNDLTGWCFISDNATNTTDGDFAEILIYNRAVTTTEQAQIETYLAQQWNAS